MSSHAKPIEYVGQRPVDGPNDCQADVRMCLKRGEAHLWYAWTHLCCTPARLDYYKTLLDHSELQRLDRLAFDHLRQEYLLTRALCRVSLSHYADVAPSAWRFQANEYGRPDIANPEGFAWLRFNLSNSHGLVACLIARDADVGVDVEEITSGDNAEIAHSHFSPSELCALGALAAEQQGQRFFELWTLKECYIKARGMGLSLALDKFSFELIPEQPIRIDFAQTPPDVPEAWQFELFRPGERHVMAAALRRGIGPDWRIRLMQTIPNKPRTYV